MSTNSTEVSVNGNVSDLIFVDIHNKTLQYDSFEYIIYNGEHKAVRRGYFRAPSVQLRTSNLAEGTYQFELIHNGKVWETAEFKKKPELFAMA